jgi:hypothetical protein
MAYTGVQTEAATSEQMGAFSGYIRRPTPNTSGMTAQIFGENGDDADTILALSLSKYQDVEVFVNIYLIKDSVGKIMKDGDQYPLISSFIGFVRRSMPKKDGMIAQFFAPNGQHADSIAVLSRSDFQDCLVFVDVRGKKAVDMQDKIKEENNHEINLHYADRITKNEKSEFLRKEKAFRKMNENLELSDFLTRIEVMTSLGNAEDFKMWLEKSQTCSHLQEKPCLNHSKYIEVPGLLRPFNFMPVCDEHHADLADEKHITENTLYYEMKHRLILKQWVWTRFKEKFSYDGKSEPDPNRIIEWSAGKNLAKYLPHKYGAIL